MKKYIRIISTISVVAIAVVVGVIAALKSIDINHFKSEIASELKNATGRDVKISGDINLSVSFSPKLMVEGVTFANAQWGSRSEMATLGLLEAEVNLLPLISGKMDINYINMSDLDLLLETDTKGNTNWDFQPAASKGDSATQESTAASSVTSLPAVRDIRIRNVRVTYIDGAQKSKFSVAIPRMNLSAGAISEPMRASANAELNDVPVEIVATMGSPAQFAKIDENPFPLNIQIDASGLVIKLDGTAHIPKTGLKIGFDTSLKATEIETIAQIANTQLPPFATIEMSARIDGTASNYKVSNIDVVLGNSDISGDVAINISGKKPVISASLTSKLLDINEISGGDKSASKENKEKIFSNDPIDFSGLNAVDANITYQANALKADVLKLKKLSGEVAIKNGKLDMHPFEVLVGDGFLRAQINIDGVAAKPVFSSKLSARGIDAGRLLSEFDFGNYLTLKTDFETDLSGAGVSLHDIASDLNGTLRIVGMDGRLNDAVISTVSTGIMDALPWVSRADSNIINCVIVDMPVKSGTIVTNKMFMDTNGMAVTGSGKINLGAETIDLTFVPSAKNVSLGSFAVPLSVSGQLSSPNVGVNPAGLVVGTIGNVGNIVGGGAGVIGGFLGNTLGIGKKETPPTEFDPCIKFLSNKNNAPAPITDKPATVNAAPQENSPPPAKELTDTIEKNIGGVLQGIFGPK